MTFSFTDSTPLPEIFSPYRVFLVDVTGVLYDGINPYLGAVETLNTLISHDKHVVFFSNAPRPGDLLKQKIQNFGVQKAFQVFTSGDAARLKLQQNLSQKVFHWGADRNKDILDGLLINEVTSPSDADLILLTAFLEQNESFEDLDPLFHEIASLGKPIICANPDKIAVHGNTVRKCAGSFGEKLEKLGAKVTYLGKPHTDFYTLFYETFLKEKNIQYTQIMMIGDTYDTDIQGAHDFGIDSLLVLTGNAEKESKRHTFPELFVTSYSKPPTYYAPSLGELFHGIIPLSKQRPQI